MSNPTSLNTLKQLVEEKKARIGGIGLGYVGLPVACMFAQKGFAVTGLEIDATRVEMINRGENPIKGIEPGLDEMVAEVARTGRLFCSTDYNALRDCDVVLVTVQTPVDDSDHRPRYAHMRSALESLGAVLKPGALVIVESTVAPGTMHGLVIPTLEKATGGRAGIDFYVGHCPERVMPGRLLYNIANMHRVAASDQPEVAAIMVTLYRNIVTADLDPTDLMTAEVVKTAENAYRDVQIAFANEVARVCEAFGTDVWTVRGLVNKSPGRNMLFPGVGVGGHCIPKDPWLLIANLPESVKPTLIPTARGVNTAMPGHVLGLTEEALKQCGKSLQGATLAILGYAYLENSDDTRASPSQVYIDLAKARGANVRVHDPYVPGCQTDLEAALRGADAAVILVAHDQYRQADWQAALSLLKTPVLIDARHILPDDFRPEGAQVRLLGRGK